MELSRLADEMYETAKDLHEIGLVSQTRMDEISILYKNAIKHNTESQTARHKTPLREKCIGATKRKDAFFGVNHKVMGDA